MTNPSSSPLNLDFAWEYDSWTPWQDSLERYLHQATEQVLHRVCPHHGPGEISWAFVDDITIASLNTQYRQQNKPTNVLSFGHINKPTQLHPWPAYMCLGDVILAFQTVEREAREQDKPFLHHALHLAVHGLLHLLGYTHETSHEAHIMEQLEIDVLNTFNIPNPYEEDPHT